MSTSTRLNHAFLDAPMLPLSDRSRYVLMSDCHRGIGSSSDNFLKNQHLYFAALQHYYRNGFTYIELGDGDELWENRNMKNIIDVHSNVFWLFKQFHEENRLYLIYGNHDIVKRKKGYPAKSCDTYFCTQSQQMQPLFPSLTFYEGIALPDTRASGKPAQLHVLAPLPLSGAVCLEPVGKSGRTRPYKRRQKLQSQKQM